jgi:subtilisin family serine protease
VAGIIGAVGNNAVGVAGVNWACKILPLRFMGSGQGSISSAIAALEYAVDHGARISCNSWGDDDHSQALEDAIREAGDRDHLFVTSAGNHQRDIDAELFYPAAFGLENILSVAATDHRDLLASKSNWGPTSVDLAAPGVYVLSTSNDDSYRVLSGTSMAAAHVAGVAAVVAGYYPDYDSARVRQRVLATVRPVPGLAGKTSTGGVVSLRRALQP